MYGKRRYGRLNKEVPPLPEAVPTFLCPKCKKAKSTSSPHIVLTAVEANKLFLYTKLCSDCAKQFQEWMK